ncbi:zinc-dependent metalloprotease [Corynebacterium pygosceleis]|uniref:Zinc-dependent metalloprotease n=1 Tax=Corynebacterium pygosceleis TaxID=2800406 RepID=A0A9Q4GL16_9CORY|nr:zinc-dependent metalloprotease [Corynebacterium pygosceleis]MCK7637741.1 zinc-dependent metalloprotease [Corynebacterium pygosceleis]MCK7674932.1 zinc-dependent metalloprotease [Corynebacterium pygosceleis]MCL0119479.1 zinc-dependent metalloprotease [Corynebacterium pygosceleis]MCX7467930.1 zinc-dependent metalloprotease [Corynebacterium pygosceleis]
MNNHGFGFRPGNDDDDDRNDGQGNFGFFSFGPGMGGGNAGGGGLGDMLNQFGQMLSGMGSSMNSPDGQGAVNYALAERIARQQIGRVQPVPGNQVTAVTDAVRLAELWLDDATELPTSSGRVEAWNAETWLEQTLPVWRRMVTPVAERMNEAQLESLPEEARQMIGPMLQMMNQMSGMNFGMQLGNALGDLARQALTGSDFGLPVAPAGVTAVLPVHLQEMSKGLDVPAQEALVYLCVREAARQRLFRHVPWLVERLVSSVEEYAAGLVIDTSHIEEAARELNLESGDPAQIQDAMQRLQGMDLSPRISSRNAGAASRLETMLALVEGWVELVVTEAIGDRIPSTAAMNEAWRRRRATGGSAEQAFSKVVGIEFAAPKVAEAMELWRRIEVAVGVKRRDAVWDHPDFLPVASDLENSAEFIDGLLDEGGAQDFDPIAEIDALEKMLAEEADRKDTGDTPESDAPDDADGGDAGDDKPNS